jgi:ketosteroid isomerase-like protein
MVANAKKSATKEVSMKSTVLKIALLGSATAFALSAGAKAGDSIAMHGAAGGTGATFAVALEASAAAAEPAADRDSIRAAIKANVRDIVSGINTHNAKEATMHDAPNVVVIEGGQPNSIGVAADLSGFKQALAAAPTWRVSLVDEVVDVPQSGDMAVYRSIYNEESMHDNVPFTHKVNVISGWSRHENGAWMMEWYVVSQIEKSHKK